MQSVIMQYLSSFSFPKPQIHASLSNDNSPLPPPPPPRTNLNPLTTTAAAAAGGEEKHLQQKRKQQKQKRKQPSVAEIERVIGAGVFRDRDTRNRNAEKNKTLFDKILSNSIGESEGPVEKKLRETGEWIIYRTEKAPSSTGKNILLAVFQWVLPLWILSFLVASGIIKLPFSTLFSPKRIISWNLKYNKNEFSHLKGLSYLFIWNCSSANRQVFRANENSWIIKHNPFHVCSNKGAYNYEGIAQQRSIAARRSKIRQIALHIVKEGSG